MEKNHVVLDLDEYNAMRDEIKELKNSEDKRSLFSARIAEAIEKSNLPDYVMNKINDEDLDGIWVDCDDYSGFARKVIITIKLN